MRFRVSVTTAFCLILALPALADVAIEKKTVNAPGGMPGAEAEEQTSTIWMGENKYAEVADGQRVVVIGGDRLLIIDDRNKVYHALDLPVDYAKLAPGLEEMFAQFAEQLQLKVEVKPTDETRDINGFPTKKSEIDVSSAMGVDADIELWMTEKVEFDIEAWRSLAKEMASLSPPGMGDILKAVSKVQGVPIRQVITMSMMGQTMEIVEEIVSVTRKDPPAGVYTVAEDYTEKPFDPMAALSGGQ